MHQREDGGRPPNAESERQHGRKSEGGRTTELANAVNNILGEIEHGHLFDAVRRKYVSGSAAGEPPKDSAPPAMLMPSSCGDKYSAIKKTQGSRSRDVRHQRQKRSSKYRTYFGVSFSSLLVRGVRGDIEGVPLSVST